MHYCENCGKAVNDDSAFCPECGAPNSAYNTYAPAPAPAKEKKSTNDIAIIAFVSVFLLPPITALVLSIIALSNIKKYDYEKPYDGFAKAALIISVIKLAIVLLAVLLYVVCFILLGVSAMTPRIFEGMKQYFNCIMLF